MSAGFPAPTAVGAGTIQSTAVATTAVPVVPPASTLAGDLVVVVCYVQGGDIVTTPPIDAGDGWRVLDSGYDSVNGYGIFIAACIAPRAGSSGYAGLTIPSCSARSAQSYSYRVGQSYRFDLGAARGSQGWFNTNATGTNADTPAILNPYQQCLDLSARGYNNAAVTTTCGNITGFTERFDTGQTAPPHGVVLGDRTVANSIQNPLITSALAATKTQRAGVRAMVPILSNVAIGRNTRGGFRRVA